MALLAIAYVLLLVLFWRDTAHLMRLWWTSSTFTHCLFILPLIGWLVWLRAGELAKLVPQSWWGGLIWLAGGAMVWMFGAAGSVALLRQLGLVLMAQALIPIFLGRQVTRGLLFPLFFGFFLVPAGEELVPPMQHLTADMAMFLLRLSGIPAYLDGIFITTPHGYFKVAEACSGVKFLVAMAALAVLVAHLCFARWGRRIAFIGFALGVAVLANGVRAFSTIWMAENWGQQFAIGADHLIYGWIFFALIMAIIGWSASHWFDRDADAVPIDATQLGGAGVASSTFGVALAAGLLVLAPMGWLRVDAARDAPLPAAQPHDVSGWRISNLPDGDWRARFDGARARADWALVGPRGEEIIITLARFPHQRDGAEMVGYAQGAVDPDSDWSWSDARPPIDGFGIDHLKNRGAAIDVLTLYRVGAGAVTDSARQVKLDALCARLLRGDERASALIIAAPLRGGTGGRAAIAALVRDAGGADALFRRLTAAP
ncbi:MAG: exosortase [Sphingomonadaceae bacterium]|nr:exosortase [Sphingomonadaceae bacterium]